MDDDLRDPDDANLDDDTIVPPAWRYPPAEERCVMCDLGRDFVFHGARPAGSVLPRLYHPYQPVGSAAGG